VRVAPEAAVWHIAHWRYAALRSLAYAARLVERYAADGTLPADLARASLAPLAHAYETLSAGPPPLTLEENV
jgi:hypothetical protein